MPQGPDHIVHVVHDLDAAGEFYARAGFTIGARNIHPWGTNNRIVQLRDVYIELLSVEEPDKLVPHAKDAFSFGAYHQDFLQRREGLSMLLLKSSDARDDLKRFADNDIAYGELFEFERQGKAPDGNAATLKFSLAFANTSENAELALAVCQHHNPAAFWNAASQRHANSVTRVASVILAADDLQDSSSLMSNYIGAPVSWSSPEGYGFALPSADVEIMDAAAFAREFGVEAPGRGLRLAAVSYKVASLENVRRELDLSSIACRVAGSRLVVDPPQGFGAVFLFEDE